jgi:hypothetical protein
MSYGSQTRNPHVSTEYDETDEPVYCRGCRGYLGQRLELTPETAQYWNGWWWCPEEAEEMRRLAKSDPVEERKRI